MKKCASQNLNKRPSRNFSAPSKSFKNFNKYFHVDHSRQFPRPIHQRQKNLSRRKKMPHTLHQQSTPKYNIKNSLYDWVHIKQLQQKKYNQNKYTQKTVKKRKIQKKIFAFCQPVLTIKRPIPHLRSINFDKMVSRKNIKLQATHQVSLQKDAQHFYQRLPQSPRLHTPLTEQQISRSVKNLLHKYISDQNKLKILLFSKMVEDEI